VLEAQAGVNGVVHDAAFGDAWAALLEGLNDYQVDSRGDVGSWTRIAAMDALVRYGRGSHLYQKLMAC